jgi:hypothetical protein
MPLRSRSRLAAAHRIGRALSPSSGDRGPLPAGAGPHATSGVEPRHPVPAFPHRRMRPPLPAALRLERCGPVQSRYPPVHTVSALPPIPQGGPHGTMLQNLAHHQRSRPVTGLPPSRSATSLSPSTRNVRGRAQGRTDCILRASGLPPAILATAPGTDGKLPYPVPPPGLRASASIPPKGRRPKPRSGSQPLSPASGAAMPPAAIPAGGAALGTFPPHVATLPSSCTPARA